MVFWHDLLGWEFITNLNTMKIYLLGLALLVSVGTKAQSPTKLQFNKPADFFEQTLVLGNGKMGAFIYGGVNVDRIGLNDITLWSGEPINANINPGAYKNLPAIRQALRNEDYKRADSLNRKLQGKFSESYAPLGNLLLEVKHSANPLQYHRELDIATATSHLKYQVGDVVFTREYFISHPDQVMVIKLTASKAGSLTVDLKFNSLLKNTVSTEVGRLKMNGYAPIHADPSYLGDTPNAVVFDATKGTRFTSLAAIKNKDGEINTTANSIGVKNATEVIVYLSIATSFNGYNKNPATEGVDNVQIAEWNLKKGMAKSFDQLKQTHLADYQSFFNRVNLTLGKSKAPELPTDERLLRYAEGKEDKNLEVLYFNYGRYLLISSSRTQGVPANLQGIWNPYMRPPWSSNYTININAEENYWLAENTNLTEMHDPLLTFISNLAETGKTTANDFYGTRGWAAGHNSDIWAMSNPVGNFGKGDPSWANWNMGGVWLSTHLWEHYVFTKDTAWLRKQGYPLMKGASQFCLDWLIEDKNGRMITAPSTSPENIYITPNSYHGATAYGATSDLSMVRELLQQTVEASKVLNTDLDFRFDMEQTLLKLHPYQIGKKGNLQEWYFDWEDEDPKHRHQSHLFGLYPGHQISPSATPDLANACRATLQIKGDETTGWSKGWRINLWARLMDGNHAYKMIRELLKYVPPDEMKTDYQRGGGTYPNLFDAHPPFQIDGNFGGAAAFAEMLVQSTPTEIQLLPALPDAWSTGAVKGLCARGGFELELSWHDKKLVRVGIKSKTGGKTTLRNGLKTKEISLQPNETKAFGW
jgi:alpha-L-fucosidase 2